MRLSCRYRREPAASVATSDGAENDQRNQIKQQTGRIQTKSQANTHDKYRNIEREREIAITRKRESEREREPAARDR